MKIIIYRGTKEIGGTAIELKSDKSRILLDIGQPLVWGDEQFDEKKLRATGPKLVADGVLPNISGLYAWDEPAFDGILISHAHLDHYGFASFVNPSIPLYVSVGTQKLIELNQQFLGKRIISSPFINFDMYKPFTINDFKIMPYLMDHSAFDASAFEISSEGKKIIYSGDFRNHGRKAICYEKFIESVSKNADILLTEGSMLGRLDEKLSTESDLEDEIVEKIKVYKGITLFQCSSQNIDRLVTFYRAAIKTNRIFIIDIYTAHILSGLKELGNNLPHPSDDYKNIKVFYPTGIKRRIYKMLGYEYLEKFFKFSANLKFIQYKQKEIVMIVRPSMMSDFQEVSELKNSLFIYSLWSGYREQASQVRFEEFLKNKGAESVHIHTSGHAVLLTLKDLIAKIEPKRIIPIHTFFPEMFLEYSDKVTLAEDGKEIVI